LAGRSGEAAAAAEARYPTRPGVRQKPQQAFDSSGIFCYIGGLLVNLSKDRSGFWHAGSQSSAVFTFPFRALAL